MFEVEDVFHDRIEKLKTKNKKLTKDLQKYKKAYQVLLDSFPYFPVKDWGMDHIGLQLDHKDVQTMKEAIKEVQRILK